MTRQSVWPPHGEPAAAVVTIGDELLLGDRVDTNRVRLARGLSELGFRVVWAASAGDEEPAIGDALAEAAARAEVVVATGGLGPTSDDRTREAVAARWDRPLREDPRIVAELRARFRSRGYHDLPAANRRQALVPSGAEVLPNPAGTAPGLHLRVPAPPSGEAPRDLILLPGVPSEMEALLQGEVADRLRGRFGDRLRPDEAMVVHTTGVAESVLAGRIEAVLGPEAGVRVAYRPSVLGVELRLSARGEGAGERLERAEARLAPILASFRFDDPSGDLAGAVGRGLRERGLRIAAAESCTGGLVLRRLTDIPGSSAWVTGGVVAYADRVKVEKLGVPSALLSAQGAVSEGVVRAMAEGVARGFGVEVGVGVTGIAGPGGAVAGKPVGTVWFAVAGPAGTTAERRLLPGDRREVRERAAQHALLLVLRALSENPGGGAG
jgi:nicotinamide-nucleotide amidase